ncbi:hypothetical protein ACFE04_009994 [Oxalis oulophora]
METNTTEDVIKLSNNSGSSGSESGELKDTNNNNNNNNNNNADNNDDVDSLPDMDLSDGEITPVVKSAPLVHSSPAVQLQVNVLTDVVTIRDELNATQNGCPDHHDDHTRNETSFRKRKVVEDDIINNDSPASSHVKRARISIEEQPSVHVSYKGLTRESKRKLEELLQQWSEWDSQHDAMTQSTNEGVECGEETYYPAIQVGLKKSSAVSFWIDNQTTNEQSKELVTFDGTSVPAYDRGFAWGLTSVDYTSNLEGGLELLGDANRCFNCASYSHSLKDCTKPRNHSAVNTARKERNSKRNQNSASRNPIRYYQNSRGGKYDDLRPGALGPETRELLGLGELDPPPWLNRMRELGYPPGYLDADDENQPSGITIFADEEDKDSLQFGEDGEIIETDKPEPEKKKTVDFPGINVPIPENANEKRWAPQPDSSRIRSHERGHHREHRRSSEFINDGPPGVDPIFSPSSFPPTPRYDSYDSFDLSRILGRSYSDRGRRSPYEDSVGQSSSHHYGSAPDHGFSRRFEEDRRERRNDSEAGYSWHNSMNESNGHRHHSRR